MTTMVESQAEGTEMEGWISTISTRTAARPAKWGDSDFRHVPQIADSSWEIRPDFDSQRGQDLRTLTPLKARRRTDCIDTDSH